MRILYNHNTPLRLERNFIGLLYIMQTLLYDMEYWYKEISFTENKCNKNVHVSLDIR